MVVWAVRLKVNIWSTYGGVREKEQVDVECISFRSW